MKKEERDEPEEGRKGLRKAVIVFAVVEALVIIPAVLYLIFR